MKVAQSCLTVCDPMVCTSVKQSEHPVLFYVSKNLSEYLTLTLKVEGPGGVAMSRSWAEYSGASYWQPVA